MQITRMTLETDWSSKKQNAVSLSSTEAEYTQPAPTLLHGDNMSALAIARDPQYHSRSKHFNVKDHDEMIADVFTKSLHKPKHCKFVSDVNAEHRSISEYRRVNERYIEIVPTK